MNRAPMRVSVGTLFSCLRRVCPRSMANYSTLWHLKPSHLQVLQWKQLSWDISRVYNEGILMRRSQSPRPFSLKTPFLKPRISNPCLVSLPHLTLQYLFRTGPQEEFCACSLQWRVTRANLYGDPPSVSRGQWNACCQNSTTAVYYWHREHCLT